MMVPIVPSWLAISTTASKYVLLITSVVTPSISTLTLFTATGKPAGMLLLAVLIAAGAAEGAAGVLACVGKESFVRS